MGSGRLFGLCAWGLLPSLLSGAPHTPRSTSPYQTVGQEPPRSTTSTGRTSRLARQNKMPSGLPHFTSAEFEKN